MATLLGSARQVGNANLQRFVRGIDMSRQFNWTVRPASRQAADTAEFRKGQFVELAPSGDDIGKLVLSDGEAPYAIALGNKSSTVLAIVVDEEIVFDEALAVVQLGGLTPHTNVSNVGIFSAVENGGTLRTVTTDYTVQAAAGTITHVANIPVGVTQYVSYRWEPTARQLRREGQNFDNSQDDVTFNGNFCPLLAGQPEVYTTEFDSNRQYTLDGTGANLYIDGSGRLTNLATSNLRIGRVVSLPSAEDPFLGAQLDFSAVTFA